MEKDEARREIILGLSCYRYGSRKRSKSHLNIPHDALVQTIPFGTVHWNCCPPGYLVVLNVAILHTCAFPKWNLGDLRGPSAFWTCATQFSSELLRLHALLLPLWRGHSGTAASPGTFSEGTLLAVILATLLWRLWAPLWEQHSWQIPITGKRGQISLLAQA